MIIGCDISDYQGAMDWSKALDQGIKFAWVKATEGSTWWGKHYERNIHGAIDLGIPVGPYHFFHPELDARRQAKHFARFFDDKFTLPPALDVEYLPLVWKLKRGRKALYDGALYKFTDELLDLTGKQCVVYTNSFWDYNLPLTDWAWRLPLWVANWYAPRWTPADGPKEIPGKPFVNSSRNNWPWIPREWSNHKKNFEFWQWSANGNGLGAAYGAQSKDIDLDCWRGTQEELIEWCRKFGKP